jgi:hypothetical protein
MAYGSEEGENVRFKQKKSIFILKIYIYICLFHVFALQRKFVEL